MFARSLKVNPNFSRQTVVERCLHWGIILDHIKHISGYDVRASYDEALRHLTLEFHHCPNPGELTLFSIVDIDTQIVAALERKLR